MSNTQPCDPAVGWHTPLLFNSNPASLPFGLAASGPGQLDTPGAVRTDVDPAGLGVRTFRFALLANSANVTVGQLVYFNSPANIQNIANTPANIVPNGVILSNLTPTCVVTGNLAQSAGANTTGTQQDLVAGVAIQNQTVNNFGWFQLTGVHPAVSTTGGAINAGDQIIPSTVNGQAIALTANATAGSGASLIPFGRATGANVVTANTVPAMLNLPNF